MAREDGLWLQDWTTGDNLKINSDGSLNSNNKAEYLAILQKMFSTNFEVSSIGSSEIPVALIRNPSGSSVTVKLYRFTFSNVHTVSSYIRVRAYGAPTVTSDGTALTRINTTIGGASPTMVAFSSPTISSNGSRVAQWLAPSFSIPTIVPLDFVFILPANTQLLLTAQGDGTNRVLAGSLLWAEV